MYVAHRHQHRSLYAVMLSRHTMYVAHRPQPRTLYAVMLSRHTKYVEHRRQPRSLYAVMLSRHLPRTGLSLDDSTLLCCRGICRAPASA